MNNPVLNYVVQPGGSVQGVISVPGDKSISHRAVMFGMLAHGVTTVSGLLYSEDVLATLACCRALGTRIEQDQVHPTSGEDATLFIHGLDNQLATTAPMELDLGNSGTAMRLLAGLFAGHPVDLTLVGDASLNERPMGRIADPLCQMGAKVSTQADGTPPIVIRPAEQLDGISYELPVASAQIKSAILLATLKARGTTTVLEPGVCRDHTERMLRGFGVNVESRRASNGQTHIQMRGGQRLKAADITVPGDLSSAAFFLVAGTISPQSQLTIQNVGVNPTRTGVVEVLQRMGADLTIEARGGAGDEPMADITVAASNLTGIDIGPELVELAIDELPIIAVAAACASGRTTITGAQELRVKESDRIAAMVNGLQAIGVRATELPDGLVIDGGTIVGGEVDSLGDHRIAMAFTIAALRSENPIKINDINNISTSFPVFYDLVQQVGMRLDIVA